ncbi:hypothetical protein GW17_00027628 [Ensete ventricosum]|nr:hypothetical protein GW17_00027628 [Ensete ventricosum]RZR85457.1 hypothetical protein BHM03_00012445 [Ensete ventricosum]
MTPKRIDNFISIIADMKEYDRYRVKPYRKGHWRSATAWLQEAASASVGDSESCNMGQQCGCMAGGEEGEEEEAGEQWEERFGVGDCCDREGRSGSGVGVIEGLAAIEATGKRRRQRLATAAIGVGRYCRRLAAATSGLRQQDAEELWATKVTGKGGCNLALDGSDDSSRI